MSRRKDPFPDVDIVQAIESAAIRPPGSDADVYVHKGTPWHADDPIVVSYPHLFAEITVAPAPTYG